MKDNESNPVIVLGASGHAKVIANALRFSGREVLGFVTPDLERGTEFYSSVILGDDDVLDRYTPDNVVLANGVGSMPDKEHRSRLAAAMRERGYLFETVVHPSAVIAPDVILEEGVQVMAGAIIQPGVHVGCDTIINTGVLLDHDCQVSGRCHLAPGVVCSGDVSIGEGTHIGTGTAVIQGISVGKKCVIAAGSVIYRDLPDNISFIQKRQHITESRES